MTHPYAPLTPHSYHDYAVTAIVGQWHDTSMHLDVLSSSPVPANGFQRATILPAGDMSAIVWGPGGVLCNAIDPKQTLYQIASGAKLGEVVNNLDMVQAPVIEILNDAPIGTEVNSGSNVMARNANGTWYSFTYPWRSRVISRGAWGPYPDTIRMGLREETGQCYNYIWARGLGCVNHWYGVLQPDGTVVGYQFWSVAHG